MSTIDDYKTAMNDLAAATTAFQPMAAFLKGVSRTIMENSVAGFLVAHFSMKDTFGYVDPARHIGEIANWPDREVMMSSAARLAAAFNRAHAVYAELPPDDKAFVKVPPSQPELAK